MKLTGDLKKEAAIEQAGMLLTDDELEKVGGGEIFDASEIDGHDPDNPWEVLNAKGEVVGRAASRNDATSRGEPMEERRIRKYVPVTLRVDENGKIRPLVIEFDEQHKYLVDKVLDARRAACRSAGGVGDRYTCRIQGQEAYLWLEKGRWFVAGKEKYMPPSDTGDGENNG